MIFLVFNATVVMVLQQWRISFQHTSLFTVFSFTPVMSQCCTFSLTAVLLLLSAAKAKAETAGHTTEHGGGGRVYAQTQSNLKDEKTTELR